MSSTAAQDGPEQVARRLYEAATSETVRVASWSDRNRDIARAMRNEASGHGAVSVYDDPLLRVRCSDLIAVCGAVLGIDQAAPVADVDQLELFGVTQ